MSRRTRVIAVGAVLVVAAAAATVVITQSGGHTASAAGSGVPAGFTTATVERRTLTERSTVDGTLGYAGSAEIYDRIGGTFTWLPAVGAVISRGGTLFKINNEPIALFYGAVPAYRALKEGVSDGPDVKELNANLVALGYSDGAITVNEHFSEGTAAAVKRWQHAEGLKETGEVELGRIVFSPGARRVTQVHVVIGQDPPGSSESEAGKSPGSSNPSGSSSPSGSSDPSGSNPSGSKKPSGSNSAGKSKPKSNSHSKSPSKSGEGSPSSGKGKEGSGSSEKEGSGANGKGNEGKGGTGEKGGAGEGGAPELALTTTGDAQVVTLSLKATQQELAHLGESVPVQLPDGTTVHGHVSEVGTVASESSGEGGNSGKGGGGGGGNEGGNGENATISVKVTLDHPVAHLDKAPVSVELVKAVRKNVLAVPATALVATGGGNFAIQALEGSRRVEIPVTPGMFANGYVQVEGSGLNEGMTVLQPS